MKKELEDKLFKKYKKLFPNGSNVDPRENLMCFGFSHGDGWYKIVDEFLKKATKILNEKYEIDIIQIKEKFGSLRIYYDVIDCTEEVILMLRKLVMEAENKSFVTCEVCGKEGKIKNDTGWVSTLCNKHRKPTEEWNG